jgi:hypothetical protein
MGRHDELGIDMVRHREHIPDETDQVHHQDEHEQREHQREELHALAAAVERSVSATNSYDISATDCMRPVTSASQRGQFQILEILHSTNRR